MKTNPVTALVKRELSLYLNSPLAYITGILFLLLSGWFFIIPFFLTGRADMRDFFTILPLTYALLIPALTMGQFAGESASGHYEILKTLPLSTGGIILGKFLAVLIFLILMLLPTLSYPLCISLIGTLDWGPVWGGYAGALLLGSSCAAIGLLCSSATDSQVTAFIFSAGICLSFALLDEMGVLLNGKARILIETLSTDTRFDSFTRGILDTRDLLYFLSADFVSFTLLREVLNDKN